MFTDSDEHPAFADLTGSFVYARMMRTEAGLPEGCTSQAFDQLGACAQRWHAGFEPAGLPRVEAAPVLPTPQPRDVFMFFISGAKEKAPAAAQALLRRLR